MDANEGNHSRLTLGLRLGTAFVVLVGAVLLTWRATGSASEQLLLAARGSRSADDLTVDELVVDLAALVLLVGVGVLAVLLALSATHVLFGEVSGRLDALCRRVTPVACRRVVAACCGVGLAAPAVAATPALAEPGGGRVGCHASCPALGTRLDGLPLPDLPNRSAPSRGNDTGDGRERASVRIVVRPGDSLWHIAERRLPRSAGDGDVQRLTNRLYALNRTTIGDDPDLIFPGMALIAPEGTS